MQTISTDFSGTEGGPPSTEAYKRAVYKQPPRHFTVQVLAPQKHGASYSYGMLISPIHDSYDRRSIVSRNSDNSNGSSGSSGSRPGSSHFSTLDTASTAPLSTDYEIWRRWEDCLYFQDLLEVQYSIMSREKRARLQAGKGVKKNGLYAHEDPVRRLHRAASFESLPPGPDPTMIAKDVHEMLPRLTKKGTLFKASKDTIEQRGHEFKALIEALLCEGEEVPTLITELRQLRVVRDFFGFWRRDQDRLEKQQQKSSDNDKSSMRGRSDSMGSRASSMFGGSSMGMYFSASNLSLQLPSPTMSEPSPSHRGPRRPTFMQGGKGAMIPASPSHSEHGSTNGNAGPRRRAQTLQGDYGAGPSHSGTKTNNGNQYSLGRPPASAPAGISFAAAMEGEYSSDSASACGSPASARSLGSPGSPLAGRPLRSSQAPSEVRYSDATFAGGVNDKGKNREDSGSGPIIVSLEEGEHLLFDDESHELARENEHHIHHLHHDGMDGRLVTGRGLQDLTIKEEDEHEYDEDKNGPQYEYPHSDYQPSEDSSTEQGTQGSTESEGERQAASAGTRRTAVQSFNRLAMFFRPPSTATIESDVQSISEGHSINGDPRSKSPTWSSRSQTPVSSARIAQAHADALRALTGGRSSSPESVRRLAPSDASIRSSVLTTTTSGSGSSNSGHANSFDTQSSLERPYSVQSSVASCVDIDRHLTSSPIILHSPIYDEAESNGYSNGWSQHRPHDSISSVQTSMTDYSIIAPREQNPVTSRPVPAPAPSNGLKPNSPSGKNPSRPLSANSRKGRMSQMSTVSEQFIEDGEDLLDSYFYVPSDGPENGESLGATSPGREHVVGSLSRPDNFPKPFQNRPPGQFHLPWTQQRPTSSGIPDSVRSSVMTIDSSLSIPTSISPSLSSMASPTSSMTSPTSASSYAPSFISTLSEESNANAVSIKVVFGEHIIAFRVDRYSALADVREKLHHKLVEQQGLKLTEDFALAYKPPGPGRVQELKATGRARSSSVSSVGTTNPGSLRVLFSQRDWLDAVGACPLGSKLTLHVLVR